MRYWLARFAFSSFILAAVLLWKGYTLLNQSAEPWRWGLCFVGAGALAALGTAGMRERHRKGKIVQKNLY